MPEIRQIRVGGVTYDVVASEDEVSASRAQQYATQAQNSATLAGNYKDTAGNYATTAKNYATTAKNCQEVCLVQAVNANDAADRAEAIVGGQFVSYGQDQGLSDTYKAQARKNISAGASNRNLLDNPWFTVNQRGRTSYSAGYSVDRWVVTINASINVLSNGIKLTTTANSWGIEQRCVKNLIPHGTTVTFSALIDDGKIVQKSFVWNGANTTVYPDGADVGLEINTAHTEYDRWYVCNAIASTHTIHAVKLELGSHSTLANDVPPDYGEELRKCMYYCRVIQGTSFIAVGQAVATTVIRFPLPYVMRARPTATLTGTAQVYGQGGPLTPSALSCTGNTTQGIEISATVSGATTGQSYMLVFSGANDKIVISADLT